MLRVFRHYLPASALLLFVCDLTVIVSIFFLATRMLAFTQPTLPDIAQRHASAIIFAGLFSTVLFHVVGLYSKWLISDFTRAMPRLIVCFALAAPFIVVFWLIQLPNPGGLADTNQAMIYLSWTGFAFAGVSLWRAIFAGLVRATKTPYRVLVVGTGKLAAQIEQFISQRDHTNTTIVGYTSLCDEKALVPISRLKPLKSPDTSLLTIAKHEGVKEIVVALDDRRGAPLRMLLDARMEGVKITSYLSFWERETRRVSLSALDPSWLIYSDGFQTSSDFNVVLKRLLDVSASLALLIFVAPLLLFCAIAIRATSPGPILYRQTRIGRNGAEFTIYKFRTMRVDAERDGIPQWATLRDPRVTSIGSLLRTMRIDELPQIINVLRGDMSFVGPRPERPFFVESLLKEVPFYSERHRVRPGITGWAQINHPYGASVEDAKAKLSFDLYYIKNYSFIFDILIILATARAILLNRGGR
ncbi:MAG TPA: TIGR03013 family XrtA/PEP-CTERM system glycosyltransferase [Stellaceae bacterium]|nr:TIGR03013 family XrtA/PEP-CTERM system glycosyltransferase [Stellaceae bacterium]